MLGCWMRGNRLPPNTNSSVGVGGMSSSCFYPHLGRCSTKACFSCLEKEQQINTALVESLGGFQGSPSSENPGRQTHWRKCTSKVRSLSAF